VVQGIAANSRVGPGIRLADGSLLLVQADRWGTAIVARPVEVKGTIITVQAGGEIKQALRVKEWKVIPQERDVPPPKGK
jgi:hypothetical protein